VSTPSSTISAHAGTSRPLSRQASNSVRSPRSRPANWYSDRPSGIGITAASSVAGSAPTTTATGNGSPGRAACQAW